MSNTQKLIKTNTHYCLTSCLAPSQKKRSKIYESFSTRTLSHTQEISQKKNVATTPTLPWPTDSLLTISVRCSLPGRGHVYETNMQMNSLGDKGKFIAKPIWQIKEVRKLLVCVLFFGSVKTNCFQKQNFGNQQKLPNTRRCCTFCGCWGRQKMGNHLNMLGPGLKNSEKNQTWGHDFQVNE